jgi:pyruvate dehydrogenase E2 component (dihydrolipoamide acetyltransferase)
MPDESVPGAAALPDFTMPSLGADMEFGKVVQWLVRPGDAVAKGDILAEVETEKGVFEVDSPVAGVVEGLLVETGVKVRVGTPLLAFAAGEGIAAAAKAPGRREARAVPGPPPAHPTAPPPAVPAAPPPPAIPAVAPAAAPTPVVPPTARLRVSPLARQVAASHDVDLRTVHGSGADGAIVKADVEAVIASRGPTAAPPRVTEAPPAAPQAGATTDMRRAIAAAVSRSKREIPHYYLGGEIDLLRATTWLRESNLRRSVDERILPAALLVKAVAKGLTRFPDLNGFWMDGGFRPSADVHVGIAISLRDGGLIAPAVLHADRLPLPDLMRALRDLVQRARTGGVRASEMTSPTVTVTNLGGQGVSTVFGVIYPPQVAIIGFGRIEERPWADEGMLGVRPVVAMSLAGDHRATDGHYGARFVSAVRDLLQTPEEL